MARPDENIKKLYNAFVEMNYEVGTEEDFAINLSDPENGRAVYDAYCKEYEAPSFNVFESRLGYGNYSMATGIGSGAVGARSGFKTQRGDTVKAEHGAEAPAQNQAPQTADDMSFPLDKFMSGLSTSAKRVDDSAAAPAQEQIGAGADGSFDSFGATGNDETEFKSNKQRELEALMEASAMKDDVKPERKGQPALQLMLDAGQTRAQAGFDRLARQGDYTASGSFFGGGLKEDGYALDADGNVVRRFMTPLGSAGDKAQAALERELELPVIEHFSAMTTGGQIANERKRLNELTRKRDELRNEMTGKRRAEILAHPFTSSMQIGASENSALIEGESMSPEYRQLQAAIRQSEERIAKLQRTQDVNTGKDVGFWRGFTDVVTDYRTWTLTPGLVDAVTAYGIKGKLDRGEKLTATEQTLLSVMADNAATGDVDNLWYSAGAMGGYMPKFMLDIALIGGADAAAWTFTSRLTEGMLRQLPKQVSNKITRWAVKAAGATPEMLARGAILANTVQAPKTAADVVNRRMGTAVHNEKGDVEFVDGASWASALYQAEGDAIVEGASEMSGRFIEPALKGVAKKLFNGKAVTAAIAAADRNGLRGIRTATNRFMEHFGLNGIFGEIGEEYAGQLARSIGGLDGAYDQNGRNNFLNLKWHRDIWVGMALTMPLMGAGPATFNAARYGWLRHRVNSADARGNALMGERWDAFRAEVDQTDNGNMQSVLGRVLDDDATSNEQKIAQAEYIESTLNLRGFNLGEMADARAGEAARAEDENERYYLQGLNASASERSGIDAVARAKALSLLGAFGVDVSALADASTNDIINEANTELRSRMGNVDVSDMRQARSLAREKLSPDIAAAALDHLKASEVQRGAAMALKYEIDEAVAAQGAFIDLCTAPDGMLHQAMMTDGTQVFVRRGSLKLSADGSVDRHNSDRTLIVVDVNGRPRMVSPLLIKAASMPVSADESKAAMAEAVSGHITSKSYPPRASEAPEASSSAGNAPQAASAPNTAQTQAQSARGAKAGFDIGDEVQLGDGRHGVIQGIDNNGASTRYTVEATDADGNPQVVTVDGAGMTAAESTTDGAEAPAQDQSANDTAVADGAEAPVRGAGTSDDSRTVEQDEGSQGNSLGTTRDKSIDDFFGPVYTEFQGKGNEAEAHLREMCEGVAKGALTYPGIAPIDLAWGDKKAGYMKIVIKHPEVVGRLQELINQCTITNQSDNRIVLESGTHKFIVSKMKGSTPTDNWLLTAYEKKGKSVSASSSDIETEPKGKRNGTATPQNGLTSDDKVSNSASEKQEGGSESSAQDTALARVPMDDSGKRQWTAVPADTAWDALVEVSGGEAGAEMIAAAQIEQAQKALDALSKKAPTYKQPKLQGDPVEMAAALEGARKAFEAALADYESRMSDAGAQLDAWKAIAAMGEERTREAKAAAEAEAAVEHARRERLAREAEAARKADAATARQERLEERAGRPGEYARAMSGWEEPTTLEEYILRQLCSGSVKLRWSDKGTSRGLGKHITQGANLTRTRNGADSEYGQRAWMIDERDGLLPETYAERLCQEFYNDYELGGDHYSEVLGELLELCSGYATSQSMYERCKELHAQNLEMDDPVAAEMRARGITEADVEREADFMQRFGMTDIEFAELYAAHGREMDMSDAEYSELMANLAGEIADADARRRAELDSAEAAHAARGISEQDYSQMRADADSHLADQLYEQDRTAASTPRQGGTERTDKDGGAMVHSRGLHSAGRSGAHGREGVGAKGLDDVPHSDVQGREAVAGSRADKSAGLEQIGDGEAHEGVADYGNTGAVVRERADFDALRERAVAEHGIVMPGLNEAVVRVVQVPRHDFVGTGKQALQAAEAWAKDNLVGIHTATDSEGGSFEYSISNDAVEKYVSRSATAKSDNIGVHLAALKKLPEIIAESIEAEVHADYKKQDGVRGAQSEINPQSLVHRFYGAVDLEGKIYRVKTTMREYEDKNRLPLAHSYEITEIELLEAPSDGVANNSGEPLAMTSNSSISAAKLLKGVEKSYDKGKYLLDESKNSDAHSDVDARSARIAGRAEEPRRRMGKTLPGRSLFDLEPEQEAGATKVAAQEQIDEMGRASQANEAIDAYADAYATYLSESENLHSLLETHAEEDGGGEIAAAIEDAEGRYREAFEKAVVALEEYYLGVGNNADDASAMARDMAARVRADVELRQLDVAQMRRRAPLEEKYEGVGAYRAQAQPEGSETKVYATAGGETVEFDHAGGMRKLGRDEFAFVERRFSTTGEFGFTGSERIESADDVAYIFRALENYSIEHSFVALVKDGRVRVIHVGMGSFTYSAVGKGAIRAAVEAFGADEVYFVHNHPSGMLKASQQDRQVLDSLNRELAGEAEVSGLIIDTTSGRYLDIDMGTTGSTHAGTAADAIAVHRFDRQKFLPGYDQATLRQIRGSADVAAYVSTLRLGGRAKVSFLVLDNQLRVVGNFHTDHITLDDSKALGHEMAAAAIQYGGRSVIPYGNFAMERSDLQLLADEVKRVSGEEISMPDAVSISNGISSSAFDEGMIHEAGAEYAPSSDLDARSARIAELKAQADAFAENYNSRAVTVVVSVSDIENEELSDAAKGRLAKEFKSGAVSASYCMENKKIYIFASAEGNAMGMDYVLFHENVHAVIDAMPTYPREMLDALAKAIVAYNPTLETYYSEVMKEYGAAGNEELAAFILSGMAINPAWVERLMRRLSPELRSFGYDIINKIKKTDNDDNQNSKSLYRTVQPGASRGRGASDGDGELAAGGADAAGADAEERRLSSADARTAGVTVGEMAAHVAELANKLHLDNVEVVTDASQLEGKRANAKGFYNKRTGKITIVIPNHVSRIDVEQTLLHEAVAHYGLRHLFGEHFDTFLDNVYESADESIRRQIDRMAAQNGWNFHTATEEYLATLAEDINFENAQSYDGWWSKVKRLFLDMLKMIGFEGFRDKAGVVLTDNELRYILWRSYKNLSEPGRYHDMLSEAIDTSKQQELKVGNYADKGIEAEHAAEPANVDEINERFNNELRQQIDGTLPEGHVYEMGMPSKYLRSTGIENLPIRLSAKILNFKSNLKRHAYSLEAVKNLVKAIQKPWAIFAYGDKAKAQNLIIGIEDNGRQFLVGLSINPTVKGRSLEINSIRNVFPKNNHEWVNWINEGKLLRVDGKEEIQAVIAKLRMNPVAFDYLDLDNAAKVVNNFENPTLPSENNADSEEDVLYRTAREEYDMKVRAVAVHDKYGDGVAVDSDGKKMKPSIRRRLHEAYFDSMASLKILQDVIAKETGKPIEEYENAYWAENRMSSMNRAHTDRWKKMYFEPIINTVTALAKDREEYRDLLDYMIAKHGLERNAVMRVQALADGKDGDRDFAGLTALTNHDPKDWQPAEADARALVRNYESVHSAEAMDNLWAAIRAATRSSLQTRYEAGLITKDVHTKLQTMYDYYIPLKGWKDMTAGDMYEYAAGSYAMGSALHGATGRASIADDPLATIGVDGELTIREANRNRMKQHLLNLAINHRSTLLTVGRQWYVYDAQTGGYIEADAPIKPEYNADEIAACVEQFNQDMKQKEAQGLAFRSRAGLRLGLPIKPREYDEHIIKVKRAGETYCIYLNGDPRAAQAVNGILNPDNADHGRVHETLQAVKNAMARLFTSYNPSFVATNLARDLIIIAIISNCSIFIFKYKNFIIK